jgi:cyclase
LYADEGADEIVILDISATDEERGACFDTIAAVREQIGIPLTVGGGVRTVADARRLLEAGADKVAVNTAAVLEPSLIREIATRFGAQCAILALDAAASDRTDSGYEVVIRSGKERTGMCAVAWAQQAIGLGAGEIVLTSFDRDGTGAGYDTELLRRVTSAVSVPVVASGGAGSVADIASAFSAGAEAVLAASIFHFGTFTVTQVKQALRESGYVMRIE